jgi:hypothetical protein
MTTTVLRRCADSFVIQNRPSENFGALPKLVISNASSQNKLAYLFFGGGPTRGVYVTRALLRVYARGAWSGSHTITARRVTEEWKENSITYKRSPADTATDAATEAVVGMSSGDPIEIDVTDLVRAAFLGAGAPYTGIRLSTSGTNDYPIHSHEAKDPDLRPVLEVDYTTTPFQAFDLFPGDGAVVSIPAPFLRWTFYDADENEQAAYQVQIDSSDTFPTPDFDTGWVDSTDPEIDLGATAYTGMSNGQTIFWRVRVQNAEGIIGEWSDPAEVTRTAKGTLVINAPTSTTVDHTPEIATTLTGQAQVAIRYVIEGPDIQSLADFLENGVELWNSGRMRAHAVDGERIEYEVPKHIVRARERLYRLIVRSWDDVENRVATPGDPRYAEAIVDFQVVESSGAPGAPGALTVTQEQVTLPDGHTVYGPGVLLSWTRSAVPDFWALYVDGVLQEDKIDALDCQVSGTSYSLRWYGAEPGFAHEYEIAALEVT